MNRERRATWEQRHRDAAPGDPEPSVLDLLPLLPQGLALDLAAGTGRNSIALARAGWRVVAVDFSAVGLRRLAEIARRDHLTISTVVADLEETFPFRPNTFDVILNVSYLDRALTPRLTSALRPGGAILFDTFTIDEAGAPGGGHLRNTRFMLDRYELRALLAGLELIRYREGLVVYPSGTRAWRATALARRGS
jgi:tellurite methyltransferase